MILKRRKNIKIKDPKLSAYWREKIDAMSPKELAEYRETQGSYSRAWHAANPGIRRAEIDAAPEVWREQLDRMIASHRRTSSKHVMMYIDGVLVGEFSSVMNASLWLKEQGLANFREGHYSTSVACACAGKREQAHGFEWAYGDPAPDMPARIIHRADWRRMYGEKRLAKHIQKSLDVKSWVISLKRDG